MNFLQSFGGKKILMALSGLLMLMFLLAHMLGNLAFHLGPEAINSYAKHLQDLGPLLWSNRIFLILVLILHVWLGISLSLENYRAGGAKYAVRNYQRATLASRSMIYTGLVILIFTIYHLLHFTFRITNPEIYQFTDPTGHLDIYKMAGLGFASPITVLLYLVGLIAVLLHIWHGVGSLLQTMGWNSDYYQPLVERGSNTVALVLFLGFISIPVSFLLFGF
ncbi:MAG: succinate dehydrogenase cytochrome b subunit [Desulfohalobiaceae bacterium]